MTYQLDWILQIGKSIELETSEFAKGFVTQLLESLTFCISGKSTKRILPRLIKQPFIILVTLLL